MNQLFFSFESETNEPSRTPRIYTIGEATAHLKTLLERDSTLQNIWVQGEISNWTAARSGHIYFTLKDEEAQIRCVMWRSQAARQKYLPEHGDEIIAHGKVSVYAPRGDYQLYVDSIRTAGVGLRHLEFEALKEKLRAEGLFDEARKRPIPLFPRTIGVVTSSKGAALQDILRVLNERYPAVEVIIAPTLVQGDNAPPQIVAAINALNELDNLDLIIVARGGGSLEDLWCFNDERVARVIAAARYPVVSGVGHETDFTIADFVVDMRTPTPSAAAAAAVPDIQELFSTIAAHQHHLRNIVVQRQKQYRQQLNQYGLTLRRLSPQSWIDQRRQRLDEFTRFFITFTQHRWEMHRARLTALEQHLHTLSPLHTLQRGYALVSRVSSLELITSVKQPAPGDILNIRVSDGEFTAEVKK